MISPDQIEGKARVVVDWEDRLIIFDCLILCRFYRDFYEWDRLAEMLTGVTGLQWSRESLKEVAGTISDNTRRFNLREGLRREDDRLPRRFYKEVLLDSRASISEQDMAFMLEEYYEVRHWPEKGLVG